MTETILPGRSVISVAGADRVAFLEGLLSCRLDRLVPGDLAYGALLTPQGKIVTDLFAFLESERIALDVPAAALDEFLRRLSVYKLRAKVTLERTAERVAVGAATAEAGLADPRAAGLGVRAVVADAPDDEAALASYHERRIAAGVPDAAVDFPLGDTFPHDANMDINHGIDFAKGCFVGQEVVSRMRHRGTARRRTVIVEADTPLPPSGTALAAGGRAVGTLGTVRGRRGLAIVRIDRTLGTADASGIAVRLAAPPGAPFRLAVDETAS